MFYIIKSNTKSIKDKLISKIQNLKKVNDNKLFIFDYEDKDNFEIAFLEYLSLSLDGENKIVVLKNAHFLNLARVEKDIERKFSNSINYDNPNTFIFTIDKLNKTGKLIKKYKDSLNIIEKDAPKKSELTQFIINYFKTREVDITSTVSILIIGKIGENFDLLITELNKLYILQNNNEISEDLVEKSVIDFSRQRLYKISEYVINLEEKKVKEMIIQFKKEGEGIYLIADFMIKEFSKFLKYKLLKLEDPNINDNEIQTITGWNIWGIKKYALLEKWENISELEDFLIDIIIQKCFVEIITYSPEKQLDTLNKILVNNIIKVKNTHYN